MTVLEIVSPVFFLAVIGFAWVKAGWDFRLEFVTRMAMTLSVPCLIFVALMKADIDPAALRNLSLAALAAYGAVIVVVSIVVRVAGLTARTYSAPLIFGNTGNVGLPLALFAYGEIGLSYAVVVFAVMAILSFTFGVWLVSGGGNPFRALKEPMVWGTMAGALFQWQGWETPTFLTNTLQLIGQMAIPLMLITLGVAVARLTPGRVAQAIGLSLLKLVICIAVPWAVGLAFALDRVAFAVLVLQVSTPVAVTSYLLATKYGADADSVAGLVVVSTLLSVVAMPLLLAVLL
nr:AEC family transporter [Mesobacterium pallidum]